MIEWQDNIPGKRLNNTPGMLVAVTPLRGREEWADQWVATVVLRHGHSEVEGETYHATEEEATASALRRAVEAMPAAVQARSEEVAAATAEWRATLDAMSELESRKDLLLTSPTVPLP